MKDSPTISNKGVFMNKNFLTSVFVGALAFSAIGSAVAPLFGAGISFAGGKGEHPRREEVNDRVRNERKRIKEGVKNGSISKDEAKKMRGELKGIKAQERAEVKANGGHLTKGEQVQLNKEENGVSKQIAEEKHEGSSGPSSPSASAPVSPSAPSSPSSPVAPAQ
jgi:hypothetical protein